MGLREYVRNSKERLLIAPCTIEEEGDKHQMSIKRGKIIKEKHSGCKNNYMDNFSGKQRAKQVKIGRDG